MTTITSEPTPTATEDRLPILELTAHLALLVDARDWNALESLFTDPVYSDRTSLFGGQPQTGTPAELAGGLHYALGGLDATHHQITCQSWVSPASDNNDQEPSAVTRPRSRPPGAAAPDRRKS